MTLAIADVLDQAADRMEELGFCQGRYQTKDGRVCMEGAIRLAVDPTVPPGSSDSAVKRWYDADDAIRILEQSLDCRPARWNDKRGRTKEEAVAALRAAAEYARTAAGGSDHG